MYIRGTERERGEGERQEIQRDRKIARQKKYYY